MGRSGLVVLFTIVILVLGILRINLNHARGPKVKDVQRLLRIGMLMDLFFLIAFFVEDKELLSLIYTLTLILASWLLYLFMYYSGRKLGAGRKDWNIYALIIRVVLFLDNLLLVYNVLSNRLFAFEKVELWKVSFVAADWTPFFMAHFTLCVLMELVVVGMQFHKAYQIAKIYRIRYLITSIVFLGGMLLDVLGRVLSGNMNIWSVIWLSLGVMMYYYIYIQFPFIRASRMKSYAINNMTDPVLMFDYNDALQVYNKAAHKMLEVYAYYKLQDYIKDNNLCYTVESRENCQNKDREFVRTNTIAGRTYLIHGHELWDEREKFIGTLVVYTDITGQERLKDEATMYATRDHLTGLWNRDYFFEMAEKTIRENPNEEFTMIATDVYHFKMFNEILGVKSGDDLLLAIAQGYRESYRRLWVFSRVSGDRFGLLIPTSDFNEQHFMKVVHGIFERKNYSLKVHCYVGVYKNVDHKLSAESMYNRAFMALENIKGDLQKEIAFYQDEIRNQRIFETTTLDELDYALLNNEFVMYLQPQIDIRDNSVVSAEALVRWIKPGRGMISPGEFIPIFENNGMIAKLDYYVWELACQQLRAWKDEGFTERSISVNISAKDFYLSDLYDSITKLVEKYRINPRNLKLEITETAFVLDVKKQMELVRRLQEYGFLIEIDDFGSGYSSLNSLKDINVDILKMDLKFFEKTDETDRAEKIVRSVVNLAHELGMPVIAEGVETADEVEMLRRVGCHVVQGYYYSKPISVPEFEAFLKGHTYGNLEQIVAEVKE